MSLNRVLYYFLKSISVNLFKRDVKVALSSQIKPGTTLGKYVRISRKTYVTGDIGDFTYIGSDCRLNARLGKYCSISPNVKVVNATHPVRMISTSPVFFSPIKQCGYTYVSKNEFEEILYADYDNKYSCIIGNDVWIGENVIIKGGITIGDGAIIAMGAVVTKDIPPYSIYGGVPAKEISKRFSDEKIEFLLNLRWWDKPHDWIENNKELFLDANNFFDKVQSSILKIN